MTVDKPTTDRDFWIENRLMWRARKQNLPKGQTQFFRDTEPSIQQAIASAIQNSDCGTPVVLAYQSADCWTLLGTRKTLGQIKGQFRSFAHADIHQIDSRDYPPPNVQWSEKTLDEMGHLKKSWEILRVADANDHSELFWVPAGEEAFAMWNLLLMATRLYRSA